MKLKTKKKTNLFVNVIEKEQHREESTVERNGKERLTWFMEVTKYKVVQLGGSDGDHLREALVGKLWERERERTVEIGRGC